MHSHLAIVLIVITLGAVGCGGGGSSGASSSGGPAASAPANPRSSTDVGDVAVTVTDVFGAPAAGASVYADSNTTGAPSSRRELIADAQGKVVFDRVPAGQILVWATTESPVSAYGSSQEVGVSVNGRVDLAVTLKPHSNYDGGPGGFAASSVAADAVSADGRTLAFTLRMFPLYDGAGPYLEIFPCAPEWTGGADCVVGPTGSVATYSVENAVSSASPIAGAAPAPFAAALLVDQSRSMVAIDPWDARLFGMKYFLLRKPPADSVQLAAFAADDTASGERSQLPQQPVSLFPLLNPRFIAAPDELLSTIDSLESLEGGAAPLYASIETLLDYTAAHAPNTVRRAVVVLTDGTDDACGSAAQCAAARERVITKSRALAVPLVIIAVGSDSLEWTNIGWPMAELAERSGGIMLWAGNTSDIGPIVERLPAILNGSETSYTGRFRIRASTDGAFRSGAIVRGNLAWGWGSLPFAVQIP